MATTRTKYARIRVVDIGKRTPTPEYKALLRKGGKIEPTPVPFMLILEPLYFGVLPATVLPTAIVLVLATIVVARFVAPKINKYLLDVAAEARREINDHSMKND